MWLIAEQLMQDCTQRSCELASRLLVSKKVIACRALRRCGELEVDERLAQHRLTAAGAGQYPQEVVVGVPVPLLKSWVLIHPPARPCITSWNIVFVTLVWAGLESFKAVLLARCLFPVFQLLELGTILFGDLLWGRHFLCIWQ